MTIRRPGGRTRPFGALRQLLGDRFSTAPALREQHGRGEAYHHAAIRRRRWRSPRSTDEVARIVEICAEHRVPVVAFGAGTSLEGHVAALRGGVSLDLTQMNQILAVHAEDLDATVEAGRHPQAAQRAPARHRPVLPDRSRVPTPRSAAWPRRAPPAPTPSATAR